MVSARRFYERHERAQRAEEMLFAFSEAHEKRPSAQRLADRFLSDDDTPLPMTPELEEVLHRSRRRAEAAAAGRDWRRLNGAR